MIKRLRIKFVLIIMGVVLIMLGIIFGLIFYFTRAGLETESLQMMRAIANEPFLMEPPGQMERPEQNVRLPYFVLHVGSDGELHATNGGYYDLTDQAFLESVASEAVATGKQHGVISDYDLRFYKQETPGKQCLVFADISSERATLESMARTCAAIGVLSLLAFLGISVVLSKWAVRPIEQAWEQQRQFVADASHELKTPLAVILTNAELANSGEYAEEERGQFIRNILTMSGHMKLLVEQMLELSRTDRTPNRGEEQTVDLSGVIANVALTFEASLFELRHPLTTEIIPDIAVRGNERQLAQIAEILLDNAGKYSAEDGSVTLSLRRQDNRHCLLSVRNEGESIPGEELENLFKRFYRADPSRKRDGSFGLGLSIAENIVINHKGKIWAESREGYNTFHVLLPTQST